MSLRLGDRNETVRNWRILMAKRFAGYAKVCGPLAGDTNEFGPRAVAWQKEYEKRTAQPQDGIVSDGDLAALGLSPRAAAKPIMFTVEGHMSSMWEGPCAFTAKQLESEGVVRWQPVGYNNTALPFDNKSGVDELCRLLGDVQLLPPGTPWGMAIFSQGAIVGSEVFLKHVRPEAGKLHWRLKDFRGCLSFGSPYRENNVVAEWVPDPPAANTQGISNTLMTDTPANWKEVARKGDLYTENPTTKSGEYKTAIYMAVQNQWTGSNSLTEQLMELLKSPATEIIPVLWAIITGAMFLGNMGPHGLYNLEPCVNFMRNQFK